MQEKNQRPKPAPRKGYWTTSLKIATYLRMAGMKETIASAESIEKIPKGLISFYYEDGDLARDILSGFKKDEMFHLQFACYYEVMGIIHGKRPEKNAAPETTANETEEPANETSNNRD
jgi:hypothetical protein